MKRGLAWTALGGTVISLVLGACLFLDTPCGSSGFLGSLPAELEATFRDPSTQWMVVGCCAVYFATFTLLERRAAGGRFWHWRNPQVWAAALLVLASMHYVFAYESASGSTHALTLLAVRCWAKGRRFGPGGKTEEQDFAPSRHPSHRASLG